MNRRKCDICNIDDHRASYVKHLKSKKHLENAKQNELIIPEWLFQEPVENKINKIYNPKSFKQIARDNIKLDDKQLNKELGKKMINPHFFTDRKLKVGFKINLDSHHNILTISKIIIKTNNPEFGIEVRYINKIINELSVLYARLKNQFIISNIKQFLKQDLINKMKIFK